jgi:hypothetical protein
MDGLRFEDALRAYEAAYRLKPDAALLYNEGRALEGLARFPEALDKLEAFKREATPELLARVGDQLKTHMEELRGRVATLVLSGLPEGATIRMGDRILGTAPLAAVRVNAGKVHLEASKEGYFPDTKDVDLPGGKQTTVEMELSLRDQKGTLLVTSPIAGARVSVDGRPHGQVPVEVKLDPGPHAVRVEQDGFDTSDSTVVVVTGQRKAVDVALYSRPITQQWWLWTLVGVGITGIAVGIAVPLSVSGPPDEGTLNPPQLAVERFPLFRF